MKTRVTVERNWVDRVIGYLNPKAGLRRMGERALLDYYARKYEGGSRGRKTSGWRSTNSSANADTEAGLSTLRARSRYLIKNNGHAANASRVIVSNVVGAGIFPSVRGESEARVKRIDTLLTQWADSTDCDADGKLDLYGIQQLVMRTIFGSGEVLIRRRVRRSGDGFAVPLQLQVLEPDYIDTLKTQPTTGGGYIIQGVEFNVIGQRTGYWIFDQHPGDVSSIRAASMASKFVPASEFIHGFDVLRPGQVRGVPWLAPVLLKMNDYAEYDEGQLVRQKIAGAFVGFIKDGSFDNVATGLDVKDGKDSNDLPERVSAGALEVLPPGKDIEFNNPPGVDGYGEYSRVSLQSIAAGLGITYEALTGDLSNVNYSSGRMGWLEFQRNLTVWREQLIKRQVCEVLEDWLFQVLKVMGVPTDGVALAWTEPRREMIDPTKEVPAMRLAVRSGFKTLSECLREVGKEPKDHFDEMAADYAKIDELGLVLETDVRKDVTKSEETPKTKNEGDSADESEDADEES